MLTTKKNDKVKPVKHQMDNYLINNHKMGEEDKRKDKSADPWYSMQNDSGDIDEWDVDESDEGIIRLVCKYDDVLAPSQDDSASEHNQIKWFLNKMRIRPKHRGEQQLTGSTHLPTTLAKAPMVNLTDIVPTAASHSTSTTNVYSISNTSPSNAAELSHSNFRIQQIVSHETNTTLSILSTRNFNLRSHLGKYKCQYKGLHKTVRLFSSQVIQSSHHSNKGKLASSRLRALTTD